MQFEKEKYLSNELHIAKAMLGILVQRYCNGEFLYSSKHAFNADHEMECSLLMKNDKIHFVKITSRQLGQTLWQKIFCFKSFRAFLLPFAAVQGAAYLITFGHAQLAVCILIQCLCWCAVDYVYSRGNMVK